MIQTDINISVIIRLARLIFEDLFAVSKFIKFKYPIHFDNFSS